MNTCPKCSCKVDILDRIRGICIGKYFRCKGCNSIFRESYKSKRITNIVTILPPIFIAPLLRDYLASVTSDALIKYILLALAIIVWMILISIIALLWTNYREVN